MTRFELVTSSLPRKRSTPELHRLFECEVPCFQFQVELGTLNIKPDNSKSERVTRLEPATYSLEGCRSTNWATPAFSSKPWRRWTSHQTPKHYRWIALLRLSFGERCGGSRIRTCEVIRQRIYSPSQLAALVSPLWLLQCIKERFLNPLRERKCKIRPFFILVKYLLQKDALISGGPKNAPKQPKTPFLP